MPIQELSNLQTELLKMYSNGVSEKNLHEIKYRENGHLL